MSGNGRNQINYHITSTRETNLETPESSRAYESYDEISDNSSDDNSSTSELDTSNFNYKEIDMNDEDPYHENEIEKEVRHGLFTLRSQTTGFRAKYALPFKYLPNNNYFNNLITLINPTKKKYKPTELHSYYNLSPHSYFNAYEDENMNETPNNTYDTPTDEKKKDERNEEQAIENKEKNCQFIHTTLLISYDSFRFIGNPTTTKLREGISDAIVVNVNNDELDDLLLVVQPNGMLLSILPTKNTGNSETDYSLEMSTVLQYWDLGNRGSWKIIAEQSSREDLNFIVTDTLSGNIKFFEFKYRYEFTMINNLCLDDYIIHSCEFFVSQVKSYSANNIQQYATVENINKNQNNDPVMLFVATTYAERIVHLCIEWSNSDPYHKRVHQLTYHRNNHNYNSIPLHHNRVLTSQKDGLAIISANQIMSGETSFITTRLPNNMKGIVSWFSCNILLKKLQSLNSSQFDKYDDCIVASSTTGTIFACLISNTDIDLHPLTRFKGVTFISPFYSPSSENENLRYNMRVMSFNRMVNIRIDLMNTINSNSVLAYQNVLSRKTEDISSDNNTKIAIIKNNIWLFSDSSISQMTNIIDDRGPLPYLKVSEVVENLRIFNTYNNIQTFKLDALASWRTFLDIEFPNDSLLIAGTDGEQIMDLYLLQQFYDTQNEEANFEITNLKGILKNNFNTTSTPLFCEPYKQFLIYGDKERVSVLCVETGVIKTYTAEFRIDGITFSLGVITIWNYESDKIIYFYCHNIIEWFLDVTGNINFESMTGDVCCTFNLKEEYKVLFIDKLNYKNSNRFKIFFAGDSSLSSTLYPYNPDDNREYSIRTQVNDFIVLDGLLVYSAEGAVIQCLMLQDEEYKNIPLPLLPTGPQDIQIRKFTRSSILAFTANRVFVINFRDMNNYNLHDPFLFELKIPYEGKENLILDISVQSDDDWTHDPIKCTLYILFTNGLKIFKPSYYSWTYTNCLLKYTRSNNKSFVYLQKLNRLAVINYDYNDWYCIKLENGKVLSLDNSVFEKDHKLINVVDVSKHSKNKQCDTLLFVFETLIKIIEISSKNAKVITKCLQTKTLGSKLSKEVCVTPDMIYILRNNVVENDYDRSYNDYPTENDMDCMFHINLEGIDQKIVIENEVKFYGKGEIGMFQFFSNKYAVMTDSCNKHLLQDLNVNKDGIFDPVSFSATDIPTDSKVVKIVPITEYLCVVAIQLEERVQYSSKLIFLGYHDRNFNATKTETEKNHYSEASHSIDNAASHAISYVKNVLDRTDNSYYNESLIQLPRDQSLPDYIDDNQDITMPISGETIDSNHYSTKNYKLSFEDPIYHCGHNGYTRVINIQGTIQDITYSPEQKTLAVLCGDQTVLQFKMGGTYCAELMYPLRMEAARGHDAAYVPQRSKRPKENHGRILRDIDIFGRIWD